MTTGQPASLIPSEADDGGTRLSVSDSTEGWTAVTHPDAVPDWATWAGTNPTVSPAFFGLLEDSGSAAPDQGWQGLHLASAQGVLPLYAKGHSYGEYVFDQGWANAAQGAGLRYYPKLVTAVPFTPCQGPRLIGPAATRAAAIASVVPEVQALAHHHGLSSWHVLFAEPQEADAWAEAGLLHRLGCQYHWFDQGDGDFDGFLGRFRASRRKTVRRERRAVQEQGITCSVHEGAAIEPYHWDVFRRCYRDTYLRRSGHGGYLTDEAFARLPAALGEQVVLVLAAHGGEHVAAALYLRSANTLYGRYWGALKDVPLLHFEACYYQGIDYCLAHGLTRFDPGAQGEHKIPRGFTPVLTHSWHWLREPRLARAVARFLDEERPQVQAYAEAAAELLPFRRGDGEG